MNKKSKGCLKENENGDKNEKPKWRLKWKAKMEDKMTMLKCEQNI